jgi:putative transport protein
MLYVLTALRTHPELAIFLTLALGFTLGRIRIRTFTLGSVVGTLLAGIIVGQLRIDVPAIVSVIFFDLFLFTTGYKVGPQFVRGLGRSALPQVAVTAVLCFSGLFAALLAARMLGFGTGTAAGLLAGALTTSTMVGTASDAIGRLGLPAAETARLIDDVGIAYAVTYLIGTVAVMWFLSRGAPRLLRVNLAEESRKLASAMADDAGAAAPRSGYREWAIRAYRLSDRWAGRAVSTLERAFAPERVFVERIRRGTELLDGRPSIILRAGDTVAVAARPRVIVGASIGAETDDRALLEFPVEALDVVVTSDAMVDRTLEAVAAQYGRGVALNAWVRGGEAIPVAGSTRLQRGDLLRLAGAAHDVERAARLLGYPVRADATTDLAFVGLGILLGGLVGLAAVEIGGVSLSLTASGGALVMGLTFGWLRSRRPTFGQVPEAALWLFDALGLAVFMAAVGLSAGPGFVEGVRRTGGTLPAVGLLVAVIPHVIAVLFGRYVLKMNPVLLLGACAGAGTSTPALRSIQDEAESRYPVIGYTVPFALGSIVLAAWGPVLVLLTR